MRYCQMRRYVLPRHIISRDISLYRRNAKYTTDTAKKVSKRTKVDSSIMQTHLICSKTSSAEEVCVSETIYVLILIRIISPGSADASRTFQPK